MYLNSFHNFLSILLIVLNNELKPSLTAVEIEVFVDLLSFVKMNRGIEKINNHKATNILVARMCSEEAWSSPNGADLGRTNSNKDITKHTIPPAYPKPQAQPEILPSFLFGEISGKFTKKPDFLENCVNLLAASALPSL